MAWGNFVLDKGYKADAAITKYTAVKFGSDFEHVAQAGAGDRVLGFSQFDVASGDITRGKGASVRIMGITEAVVKTGQTFTPGAYVAVDAGGVVKVAGTGDDIIGIALKGVSSSAAGVRIPVLLSRNGKA